MELAVTNIVVFRDKGRGVVVGWKDNKPAYVVGARFTNPVNRWNDKGRHGGKAEPTKYDIVAVYDGSSIENPTDAFKASTKVESLPPIWQEEN